MAELQNHDEQLMRAYLLGKLAETERLEVEQRYFTEDDFFLQISALEEEIIRDFVRGELPAADVAEFERRIAEAPDLARKVVEERALLAAVTGPMMADIVNPDPARSVPAPSFFRRIREAFRSPVFAYSIAAVSVVFALAATLFWGIGSLGLRHEVAQLSASKRQLEAQLAQALPPPPTPHRLEIDRVRGGVAKISTPGLLRLGPPSLGSLVRLEVDLAGMPVYRRYQATLRTMVGNVDVLSQDLDSAGGSMWVFVIPEVALRAERYRLDIRGITENGVREDLPSAAFEVIRTGLEPRDTHKNERRLPPSPF